MYPKASWVLGTNSKSKDVGPTVSRPHPKPHLTKHFLTQVAPPPADAVPDSQADFTSLRLAYPICSSLITLCGSSFKKITSV